MEKPVTTRSYIKTGSWKNKPLDPLAMNVEHALRQILINQSKIMGGISTLLAEHRYFRPSMDLEERAANILNDLGIKNGKI